MSDYCAKSIILTPSLLEWENDTRGILIIVLLSKYKNGEILKKYKFYGEILLLVCLILFDVAIFSQILGIPIAPVTSITNSLFDALSNNESTHDPAGAVQVGAHSEHTGADGNMHHRMQPSFREIRPDRMRQKPPTEAQGTLPRHPAQITRGARLTLRHLTIRPATLRRRQTPPQRRSRLKSPTPNSAVFRFIRS